MSSVTVGDVFVDEGTLASGGVLLSVLDSGLDGKDVHTVDLQTGDVLTTLVVVGESRRTVSSSSHTVLVVYAELADCMFSYVVVYPLSQPKITGRFQSLAMLKASKT